MIVKLAAFMVLPQFLIDKSVMVTLLENLITMKMSELQFNDEYWPVLTFPISAKLLTFRIMILLVTRCSPGKK